MYYKNQRIERMHKRNKTGMYSQKAVDKRRLIGLGAILIVAVILRLLPDPTQNNVSHETQAPTVTSTLVETVQAVEQPYTTLEITP